MIIPTAEVTGDYLTDPETEIVLFGDEIREGYVVMIEDGLLRHTFGDKTNLERNRWCQVERMRDRGEIITFIARYADGSQMSRTYSKQHCWIVKTESIEVAS